MPRYDDEDDDRPRRRPRRDEDEDDDERPRVRRRPRDYEDEDRPRRRSGPKRKQQSVLGTIALITGIASVFIAFVPCVGVIAILPGLAGLVLGFIALLKAHQSDGRLGSGMPIAGLSVSAAAVIIAAGWLIFFKNVDKEIKQEMAQEREERKATRTNAAKDVLAATAPIRVSAVELASAYDRDEDQADAVYKDKVLEVSGTILELSLDDDDDDTYLVLLRGGRRRDSVDCQFAKDPALRAQLTRLKAGDMVTIRGKCTGWTTLEGCILVR